MEKKNVLITGGAGFLGSNLAERIIKRGDSNLTIVDNLWTGSMDNIKRIGVNTSNCRLIIKDVASLPSLIKAGLNFDEFDEIYHMASPASPVSYQDQPLQTIRANIYGSFNCLDLLAKGGKILFTSTSEVYGDPLVSPQPESYKGSVSCIGPRACYDESKRCSETIFTDAHRKFNINARIVRIFNAYGPGTLPNDGRAVSNFIWQALNHKPITVFQPGTQTRCFTYVDDIIDGIEALMAPKKRYIDPVNIGVDHEMNVMEMAEFILSAVPESKSKIVIKEAVVDDPQQRKPDLTRARKVLKWAPKYGYEEGIRKTIDYFRVYKGKYKL